ncbi:right-handed parallel beta-helix repeat-containing protein [Nocardioides zeae]|uniref:Right-handed parallel beta-helix repeat-containing protein n=1 Tax=Nocardioides zeae TaxID=1457234 RepID=A0A6P0HLE7_9ACTN|nr:right-handed parallel beta-helix repeat-containing protein [Nocardioides zeae]NEN79529.1 right-handed parallel beta-helix repeat-containing protein [Nocardioides zeae]
MSTPGSDLFSAEERGDTVPRWARVVLRLLALAVLLGATAGVVWGNDALRERVGSPHAAAATPADDDDADTTDAASQVAALRREDTRLRSAVALAPPAGTWVLTARPEPYTLDDLVAIGAVTGGALVPTLVSSIVVARGARLDIVAPGRTLRMRSDADGFVSIVAWDGDLRLAGTAGQPLRIVGWDPTATAPDSTTADGRAYIRVKDGRLDVAHVAANHLGFWSGRTGGIALTGTSETLTRAFVTGLDVSDAHLGMFLSGVSEAVVDDSSFTRTQQDGVEVTSGSTDVLLRTTRIADVGGDGLLVSRGSSAVTLEDVAVDRAGGYGARVDGAALADGPNSAGWSTDHYADLDVDGLKVRDATRGGVRIDAMDDVTLADVDIDGPGTALDLRGGSTGTTVTGSTLVGGSRALRVAAATEVRVDDVTATAPETAVLVEQGAEVEVDGSALTVDEGHAAVAQGSGTTLAVAGGSVTGLGPGAVVARSGAEATDTDIDGSGWTYRPVLVSWALGNIHALLLLLLLPVPLLGLLFVVRRRRSQRELRQLFADEMTRLGQARLAEYAAEQPPAPVVGPAEPAPEPVPEPVPLPVPEPEPEPERAPEPAPAFVPEVPPVPVWAEAPDPVEAPVVRVPVPAGPAASMQELAISAVVEQGYRASDVARSLGVPTSRVRGWVADHLRGI